ncbi:MAG TPA: SRPBCC domain-containing protein [Polyangia bacterium]|nr:SRPBCC domain-containing protein [Polyangia bacterium]
MRAAGSASDLVDDRQLAVPPELVFGAWTVPEHFVRWFGPYGVEVPFCQIDARPGGEICFQHRFPTGELVFVDSEGRPTAPPQILDWSVGAHVVLTVEVRATRRGTRMTVRQRVAETEAAEIPPVVRHRHLAGEGWRQSAERLAEYLARRSPSWPG